VERESKVRCDRFYGALIGMLLHAVASIASAAPTVGLNFSGLSLNNTSPLAGFTYAPPDTMGDVGSTQIVQFINGGFAVYNKSTGAMIGSAISDRTFWSNAGISTSFGGVSDPRIQWDPLTQRWFAVQITTPETSNNNILIARSETADATGAWKGVKLPVTNGYFADYPTMSVNADAIVIGSNDFNSSDQLNNVSLYSLPKSDILATTPTVSRVTRFDNLNYNTYGFTFQPVLYTGTSAGHTPVVSLDVNTGKMLRMDLTGVTAANATLSSPVTVNVSGVSDPPAARQPGTAVTIDSLDSRFSSNVVQMNGRLYGVRAALGSNNHSVIHWFIVDEATNALVNEGAISSSTSDLIQPSIAANGYGNFVIGFNLTGTNAYPASWAIVGTVVNNAVAFNGGNQLKASTTNYNQISGLNPQRWGDFSATRVDPNDSSSFFTFQEVVASQTAWGTQISQIKLNASPYTWRNNTGTFSTTTRWFEGAAPTTDLNNTLTFGDNGSGGAVTFGSGTGQTLAYTATMNIALAGNALPVNKLTLKGNAGTNPGTNIIASSSNAIAMVTNSAGATPSITSSSAVPYTISAPLQVANDLAVSIAGAGKLTLGGLLTQAASTTITKSGTGQLVIGGTQVHGANSALVVNAGDVQLNSDAGTTAGASAAAANLDILLNAGTLTLNGTQDLRSLRVADNAPSTAFINLASGAFVSIYGNGADDHAAPSRATTEQLYLNVLTAFYGGAGIRLTPGSVSNPSLTGITLAQYADAHGETADALLEDIIGDLDLDGIVTTADLAILLHNLNVDPASRGYSFFVPFEGDLDFDGLVTTNDLAILLHHINQSFNALGGASASSLTPSFSPTLVDQNTLDLVNAAGFNPSQYGLFLAQVPEPATLALLAAATLLLRRRGRVH
jgi:hypothetical protein